MALLLTGALLALGAALLVVGVFAALSRWVPNRFLAGDEGAGGAIYASVGMVYAILIAIAAIAVWEPHSAAAQSADREAGDLTEIYWVVRGLPEADRDDIQAKLRAYTTTVVDVEWPQLKENGDRSVRASAQFDELRTRIDDFAPRNEQETATKLLAMSRIADAADARRGRISAASATMPTLMWPALILGGVVSIGFLFLMGIRPTFPNMAMFAVVGAMTAILLFVIYQIEFPYSRGFAVGPDDFRTALDRFTELR